ncbi:sugar ABC transporter substrate-binding protein [Deinococcus psychrotolerans]|uniref:Sugar ABC transporter substrate-binding protein n=1 Tax=Deinococcus psychrotolerans TaxID=2489213 RepID=A0A3G8YGQ7_9DEIO|nr:sugar ABC transporter substrate-binding protein [Deinococcus psychrotolerans]AZI44125.1 sugar ABC transporter substrate-binding protein [Deinococcus psychrotolerans]
MKKMLSLTAALSLLAGPLASGAQAATTLQYWLWDSNQQPVYQQCATAFTKANPDISVKITQKGWGDYWTAITTGFVSGTAPDVFTDHLAYFPDFATNNQLVDLAPLIAKDNITTKYYPGLKELWAKGGKQYGLPKDWDTVGIFYNADLLAKAGLKPADLANLTWNPTDGGTWQSTIAKLTKDKSGVAGTSAKFDKKNVAQYGYETGYGAGFNGQTEWSFYAATTGWKYNNGLFGNKFYYDDSRLASTIQWLADLNLKHGLIPSFQDVTASGGDSLFRAGKVAMVTTGSWLINDYTSTLPFKVGIAPLPKGVNGKRMSMFNGLADSIWVGSKNQDAAWKWVKYMASPACQNVVGKTGAVFPAIPAAAAMSIASHKAKGVDATPFINQAKAPGGTFFFPISDNTAKINDILTSAMQSVFLGKTKAADSLKDANAKVNALFK